MGAGVGGEGSTIPPDTAGVGWAVAGPIPIRCLGGGRKNTYAIWNWYLGRRRWIIATTLNL